MSEQDDLANSMDQTEEQPADLGQLASQLFSESELQAGLAAAYNSDGLAGMAGLAQRIACPGDVVAGRYRLIEMIGEGGMSTVWYAEQLVPVKRKVALKLIKPGMESRTVIARFEAERQALAMMDHPNIAKVLDGGLTDWGHPFFVLELIRGTSITRFCDDRQMSLTERLQLLIPVCQAIQHAHVKGIIHRDIKPSNVLVALFDGTPVPKVIDFGVAKAIGGVLDEFSIHTSFGSVVGTAEYMSPEQAELNNLDIDTRTDVYSLGVLAYELLAGSPPFSRSELLERGGQEILRVIREVDPPKPSVKLSTAKTRASIAASRGMEVKSLSQVLQGDLDWIIMKSLEKDRSRRYVSADALANDLRRFLNNEPIEARQPSSFYLLRKWASRYRAQAITIALVFLTMFVGAVGTTLGFIRSERLRRQVEIARLELQDLADKEHLAKTVAIEQKELAERAEELALASYRESTNDAIEKLIGSKVLLSEQEREYLDRALKRWLEFAERSGDDARSARFRAEAYDRLSLIREMLGDEPTALADRRRAVAAWEQSVQADPTGPDARNALARSRRNLGIILVRQGSLKEAQQIYEASLAAQRVLLSEFPDNDAVRAELAQQIERLATTHSGRRDPQQAIEGLRAALAIHRQLGQQSPDKLDYQYALAVCTNRLAGVLHEIDDDQAEAHRRESLAIFTRLVDTAPQETLYAIAKSDCQHALSRLLTDQSRFKEAESLYREAIDELARLARRFPSMVEYKRRLASTRRDFGLFLRDKLARIDEAIAEVMAANVIFQELLNVSSHESLKSQIADNEMSLGYILSAAGRLEEAKEHYGKCLKTRKELVAIEPTDGRQMSLAVGSVNLGALLLRMRDYHAAIEICDQAIALAKPQLDHDSRLVTVREVLIDAHRTRAQACKRLGMPSDGDWDTVFKLLPADSTAKSRHLYARTLVEAARTDAAITELENLVPPSALAQNPSPWSGVDWLNFACLYAQLSVQSEARRKSFCSAVLRCCAKPQSLALAISNLCSNILPWHRCATGLSLPNWWKR